MIKWLSFFRNTVLKLSITGSAGLIFNKNICAKDHPAEFVDHTRRMPSIWGQILLSPLVNSIVIQNRKTGSFIGILLGNGIQCKWI